MKKKLITFLFCLHWNTRTRSIWWQPWYTHLYTHELTRTSTTHRTNKVSVAPYECITCDSHTHSDINHLSAI